MRLPYVLLLAMCIVIASCDALSAFDFEQEAAAPQIAQLRDTSGKRLLRSEFVPADGAGNDEEERGIPSLSKLKDVVQKGKTKANDQLLKMEYNKNIKIGFTDEAINKAWIHQRKAPAKIFDRWIRLGKSERQAANNLLREGTTPKDLFTVLKSRGMGLEDMYKVWSNANLDETILYKLWYKSEKVN
ncbi:hypothetical protein JG688_00015258 [Phytophthora aleatoria]|uniref:RxLR effector protein n=1 Tax=Phytophthora aleatoria TaxID=2496075 RepID=A0A8J5IEJ3_9STRA|nr:hypothetical protein JG688_00015258 [Phytophthora aleatoria]